ncbi:[NiFe] hydrogenase metallocenter assembly protein HypE [Klebsiella pneumoniae IS10]|nr:[NiFe] hydrogenase metallocenter assembly protein HypE [Klebsiella pneumoniae IS10]
MRGVCELLGLDALNFANEGKLVLAVARDEAENVLAHLRSHALGRDAAIIGEVVARPGVRSVGLYGVKRTLDLPHAEPLREFVNDGVGSRIAAGALSGLQNCAHM